MACCCAVVIANGNPAFNAATSLPGGAKQRPGAVSLACWRTIVSASWLASNSSKARRARAGLVGKISASDCGVWTARIASAKFGQLCSAMIGAGIHSGRSGRRVSASLIVRRNIFGVSPAVNG